MPEPRVPPPVPNAFRERDARATFEAGGVNSGGATAQIRIIDAQQRVALGWLELAGVVIVGALVLVTQILGKQYAVEVGSVSTLLAWYVGKRTASSTVPSVVERSLLTMPRERAETLLDRVTGRPPRR